MGGALTVLTDTCAVFTIHDRQQRHSAAGGLCSQSIPTPPTTALSPPHLILSPALHHGTNVKGKTVACGDMMARACVIHIAHVARQNARRVSVNSDYVRAHRFKNTGPQSRPSCSACSATT